MKYKVWHWIGGGVLALAALFAVSCGDDVASDADTLSAQSQVASGSTQENPRTAVESRTAASPEPAESSISVAATESEASDSADDRGAAEEPKVASGILLTPPEPGREAASDSSADQDSSFSAQDSVLEFRDARSQAAEFIAYYNSIALTAEHKGTRADALSAIPAPCCDDYPLATCCCECNLAKSVWGLASFLITERSYGSQQVREAALEWIQFINPDGFRGDACFTGGCKRPFAENGCGGMNETRIF